MAKKQRGTVGRVYDDQYKNWIKSVFARDGFKCRKCGKNKALQAHHIKRWADAPQLRYALGNGITLCAVCHGKMAQNEMAYEELCVALINPLSSTIEEKLFRMRQQEPKEQIDDEENENLAEGNI